MTVLLPLIVETTIVKFNFPNKLLLELKGGNTTPRGLLSLVFSLLKLSQKGAYISYCKSQYLHSENPPIELVPIVREF